MKKDRINRINTFASRIGSTPPRDVKPWVNVLPLNLEFLSTLTKKH